MMIEILTPACVPAGVVDSKAVASRIASDNIDARAMFAREKAKALCAAKGHRLTPKIILDVEMVFEYRALPYSWRQICEDSGTI